MFLFAVSSHYMVKHTSKPINRVGTGVEHESFFVMFTSTIFFLIATKDKCFLILIRVSYINLDIQL